MRIAILLIAFSLVSCGKEKTKQVDPGMVTGVSELKALWDVKCDEAKALVGEAGWVLPDDGDGMLWSGMLGATRCDVGFDPTAAEYQDQPGRFDRAPPPGSITSANPNWSSWSRDMQKGLLWWAWRKGPEALPVMQRHIDYGRKKSWKMGEPFGDGRSIYTPSAIGLTFQVAWALGGEDDVQRLWPDIYPSGLNDYRAHIQVKNIMLRAEIEASKPDQDAVEPDDPIVDEGQDYSLLDVSEGQLERLLEHAEREPRCGFYQSALAVYRGGYQAAIDALLSPDEVCSYVRCHESQGCFLADWLFSADLVLRRF